MTLLWVAVFMAVPSSLAAPPSQGEGRPILDEPDYATLRSAWYEVQSALSRDEWAEAQGRLVHVREIKADLGLPNAFELSSVLLRAARRAKEADADDVSLSFVEAATTLSPAMSFTRFAEAGQTFSDDVFELPMTLKHVRLGYERLADDLRGWSGFVANALSGLLYLVLLSLIAFLLATVVRYGGCAATDLKRLARRSIDRLQGWMLFGSLALVPLGLGLGLLGTLALLLLALSLYQDRVERFVTFVILGTVGFAALASDLVERGAIYKATPEAVIYRCNLSLCGAADRRALGQMSVTKRHVYDANYTLALLALRGSTPTTKSLDAARQYVLKAIEGSDTWQARVVHGNIAYAEALTHCEAAQGGDAAAWERHDRALEEALAYWDIALKKQPDSVAANHNTAVASKLLGRSDDASKYSRAALRLDGDRVDEFKTQISKGRTKVRCGYWAQPNRHIMVPFVPWEDSYGGYFDELPTASSFALPVTSLLSGVHGPSLLAALVWPGAGVVLVLIIFGWLRFLSTPCRRCPSVADPISRVDLEAGAVCEDCVLADVGRGVVDAKRQWRRDQMLTLRRLRRRRLGQLMTWIVPGFVAITEGRAVRGMLATSLFYACVILSFDMHVVVEEVHHVGGPTAARMIPLITIAAVVYVVSLVRVHRRGGAS